MIKAALRAVFFCLGIDIMIKREIMMKENDLEAVGIYVKKHMGDWMAALTVYPLLQ